MNELYNILSIFLSSGWLLAFGLVLLFVARADSPMLGNYRKARNMMAAAYIFFACLNLSEYVFSGSESNIPLLRTITLAIAASQAFLFTFAMFALLEVRFPGWRSILQEAALAIALIAAVFIVYTACPESCFKVAFWILTGAYALLLVRYSILFLRNYRRFRRRMDNFYSDNEAGRLRWVAWSFFAALAVGVGALLTTVFMSTAVALVFTAVFDIFYAFFAIRFIGYTHRFHTIEAALENSPPEEIAEQQTVEATTAVKTSGNFDLLERRIGEWIADKGYVEKGLTINSLVPKLYTNRDYLSTYINTSRGKTFREWVNELRIDEAKRLLTEYPDMTVGEISEKVGFVNKSHFGRTFLALTKSTPQVWRAAHSGRA
jgi:AraC-like DNA-binding protein/type IV secretory pathway TrbD component